MIQSRVTVFKKNGIRFYNFSNRKSIADFKNRKIFSLRIMLSTTEIKVLPLTKTVKEFHLITSPSHPLLSLPPSQPPWQNRWCWMHKELTGLNLPATHTDCSSHTAITSEDLHPEHLSPGQEKNVQELMPGYSPSFPPALLRPQT